MTFTGFDLFKAFGLGIVAGLTEFVPVSSTGHVVLAQRLLGFPDSGFGGLTALIRLGALMALMSIYIARLERLAAGVSGDPAARRFAVGLLVAALPAAVIGALAHDVIVGAAINLWIVCFVLIVGGAVLLWVDQLDLKPRHRQANGFSLPMYFAIGIAQCLAVIPGVSRSGASIVAAMLLGADRRAAAEFSLWLAMPTLGGVLACDLYRGQGQPSAGAAVIAIGFAASFLAAWLVVRSLLDHVSRHGFKLFAWWRVIVGTLGLIVLAIGH
ncbi:MAG TPA: undecaprenyl-diphosphate phosphatase [Xanthobacteraceae bacterium]|jgi:undecaprenyl-diphosphatase|nr:undecaprenyl-diphosphate phosphatase [Xanthobacteraceae bacterium]